MPDALDSDQQKLGVEQEHEGEDRGADVVEEGLHARLQGIGPRDGGGGEGGEANGRGRVREEPVVEHVQVHRDEREDETGRAPELHEHAAEQGGDDEVVRGRRQPHPQNDAEHRGESEQEVDVAAGDRLDHADHRVVEPGRRDRADDDPGRRHCHRDADHVARPRDHAEIDLGEAVADRFAQPRAGPPGRGHHPAGDDDHHQREDGIEDGAVRAPPLDDQQVDEDDDRNEMVQAAEEGRAKRRDLRPGEPREAELLRLEVRDVEERDVAQGGGDGRRDDHVEVRDADELGDDEGGGPHDRRHHLAVRRGGDLDRPRLDGGHADPPHDGNGERAGGDDVRDRGARDHAGHARG